MDATLSATEMRQRRDRDATCINKDIINNNNIYTARAREESFVPNSAKRFTQRMDDAQYADTVREIIAYLNDTCKVNISPDLSVNHDLGNLIDRLKAGRTIDDCKKVIANKAKDDHFKNNKRLYNCKTLFSEPNFSRYINEPQEESDEPKQQPVQHRSESQHHQAKTVAQQCPSWQRRLDIIKAAVRDDINEHAYHGFIEPLVAVNVTDDVVTLYSEDASFVREHYGADLQKHMDKKLTITDTLTTKEA